MRLAQPAQRDALQRRLSCRLVLPQQLAELSLDYSGGDGVDADMRRMLQKCIEGAGCYKNALREQDVTKMH